MTGQWAPARPPRDTLTQGEDRWDLQAACFLNPLFMKDDYLLTEDEAREVRRTCAGCPVKAECLEDALADAKPFGMRAGLTVAQRTGGHAPPRYGARPWTPEEDARVLAYDPAKGVPGSTLGPSSAAQFARELGRTVDAVRCRRNTLRRRAEREEKAS